MDEIQAIQAAQKGDLAAFNRLVMAYQGLAYNVAYRILGDSDASADVTQDSFVKAYKSLRQYRGGSFKAWLLRILTNTFINRYRRGGLERDVLEGPDADPLSERWIGASEIAERCTDKGQLNLVRYVYRSLPSWAVNARLFNAVVKSYDIDIAIGNEARVLVVAGDVTRAADLERLVTETLNENPNEVTSKASPGKAKFHHEVRIKG